MVAWGSAAAVAACVGPLQARVIPRLARLALGLAAPRPGAAVPVREHRRQRSRQLRTYGLGLIVGLAAVGYVQAAALLMGPFQVIFFGITLVTVPEAARILRHSPQHLRLYCLLVGGGLAILGLAWGGMLLIALPRGLGNLLLGKQLWRPAATLVLPWTLSTVGYCLIAGATAGLHALGAAKRSLRAVIITSVMYLTFSLIGAFIAGAVGTVAGAALATWLGAGVSWWQLQAAIRNSDQIPAHGSIRAGRRDQLASRRAVPAEGVLPGAGDRPAQTSGSQR